MLQLKSQDVGLAFNFLSGENVLPESEKYYISKDSKGYVWIGSDNGIVKFDGTSTLLYQNDQYDSTSLSENLITSECFEDKVGDLWFTTFNSVQHYSRKDDKFYSYQLPEGWKNSKGFYFENESELWIRLEGQNGGTLFKFDIHTKSFHLEGELSGDSWCVIEDSKGKIQGYIAGALSKDPGIIWYKKNDSGIKKVEFDILPNGERRNFSSPTEKVLMQDDSVVWVGLYDAIGRYKIGDNNALVFYEKANGIEKDVGWVYDLVFLNDSLILSATTKGLFAFNIISQQFSYQYQISNREFESDIKNLNRIFLDSTNLLIVSNDKQELAFAHIEKPKFGRLKEMAGLSISSIVEDHMSNVWCSTEENGVFVYNPKGELLFVEHDFINKEYNNERKQLPSFSNFIDNENSWWAQHFNFFFYWNVREESFEFRRSNFLGVTSTASDRVNCYYQLSNKKNLLALGNVIYEAVFNDSYMDTLPWYDIGFLNLNNIISIYEDNKRHLYISDDQGQLVVIDIKNDMIQLLFKTNEIGVCHDFYNEDQNDQVWIVSSKGLFSLNSNYANDSLQFERIELHVPGAFNGVSCVGDSVLWLSGAQGLGMYNVQRQKLHKFTSKDGLISSVFSKNAHLLSSQTNEVWLGSKNGVQIFDPANIDLLKTKPNVVLSNILVNDEDYDFEIALDELEELKFEYGNNTLSFNFTALDYSDPESNQFYYQMEGVDDERVSNGNTGFARYANLPAGSYTFNMWATNSDLVLNETPLSLGITILPPFYQTWWFISLCILGIAAIIYAIFQYRLEQALKVERLRVKISSDLHDDVGGLLSGLAMQSEILELTADDKVKPKLKRISEISRNAMSRMRDTVWAIDARKDNFESLIDRLNDHAQEVLAPKGVECNIKVEHLNKGKVLPTELRQNLYLIFKEALTNVARHSNASSVVISAKADKDHVLMSISDNGKTKESVGNSAGLGLQNMKMRAEKIGGSLSISKIDGYEVFVRFPKW